MKMLIAASFAAVALVSSYSVNAQFMPGNGLYSFRGSVPCTKGQLGCALWPGTSNWVTERNLDYISGAYCGQLLETSLALTGEGFCFKD